jgi:ATP-dependent Clp protease ATP-binding subunit ClpA
LSELKNHLSPEFLNRIDYKIVFNSLDKKTLSKILKIKIDQFLATWKVNSDISLPKFTDKKISEIIEKIYQPEN